jgi:HK97 family phage major capsid protein
MPNILELKRQAAELQAEVRDKLEAYDAGRITAKAFTEFMNGNGDGKTGAIARDKEIADGVKAYNAASRYDGLAGAAGATSQSQVSGFRGKATQYAPIDLSTDTLKQMHGAIQTQTPFVVKTKDFSSVDSLLPSELQSTVVGPQHETRLLERLPVLPTSAPSIEYIRHLSTTGTPAVTAEGAVKPELKFNTDRVIVAAQKIACHAAMSWETLTDWDVFASYFTNELQRQVIDAENAELLNGDGTTGHLTGLLSTSGILTHATFRLWCVHHRVHPGCFCGHPGRCRQSSLHPCRWEQPRPNSFAHGAYLRPLAGRCLEGCRA